MRELERGRFKCLTNYRGGLMTEERHHIAYYKQHTSQTSGFDLGRIKHNMF